MMRTGLHVIASSSALLMLGSVTPPSQSPAFGDAGTLPHFLSPPRTCWLGDSRTRLSVLATNNTRIWSTGSYVTWLRWLLGNRIDTDMSLVLARSGVTSEDWAKNQVPTAIQKNCRLAITQIGLNDILSGRDRTASERSLEDGISRLSKAKIPTVLISILPSDKWGPAQYESAAALNTALAKFAATYHGIIFHDVRGVLIKTEGGTLPHGALIDGIHDSSKGAASLAQAVFPSVDNMLPRSPAEAPHATLAINGNWTCPAPRNSQMQISCSFSNRALPATLKISGSPPPSGSMIAISRRVTVPQNQNNHWAMRCHISWDGGSGFSSIFSRVETMSAQIHNMAEDGNGTDKNAGQLVPGPFPVKGAAHMQTPPISAPATDALLEVRIGVRMTGTAKINGQVDVEECSLIAIPN